MSIIVAVNNDSAPANFHESAENQKSFSGALTGQKLTVADNCIDFTIPGNSGEIWIPERAADTAPEPVIKEIHKTKKAKKQRKRKREHPK